MAQYNQLPDNQVADNQVADNQCHVEDPQDVGTFEQPLLSAVPPSAPPDAGMLEQPLLSSVPPSAQPQMIKFNLCLPGGAVRGQQIQFVMPNGMSMTVEAPYDVGCGRTIEVDIPASAAQANPYPSPGMQPAAQIIRAPGQPPFNPGQPPFNPGQPPFNPGQPQLNPWQPPFNPGQEPQSDRPFFDMNTDDSAAKTSWILFLVASFLWVFMSSILGMILWLNVLWFFYRLPLEVRNTRVKQKNAATASSVMFIVSFMLYGGSIAQS